MLITKNVLLYSQPQIIVIDVRIKGQSYKLVIILNIIIKNMIHQLNKSKISQQKECLNTFCDY
jgi:hypothetical protein